jgi:hypothetical protein
VHGRQILAYKMIRKLNNSVRESVHLNCIEEEEWRRHYENLWYNEEYMDETTKINEPHRLDNITIEEVKEELENSMNRKNNRIGWTKCGSVQIWRNNITAKADAPFLTCVGKHV